MQKIEFKNYPDTSTLINAENLKTIQDNVEISINEVDNKNTNLKNQVVNGWYEIDSNAVPTFTFVSYDSTTYTGVVNSNLDLTTYLNIGMKFKFTQNSAIKYAFITAITSTQLTLFLGTDYSINSSAISNTYYSMLKAPYGFPINPDKWTITVTDTTLRSKSNPVKNTIYYTEFGSLNISIPIGIWNVSYSGRIAVAINGTGSMSMNTSLSTSTTSITDPTFTNYLESYGTSQVGFNSIYKTKKLSLTSKTVYYYVVETKHDGILGIYNGNNLGTFVIKAVCDYL